MRIESSQYKIIRIANFGMYSLVEIEVDSSAGCCFKGKNIFLFDVSNAAVEKAKAISPNFYYGDFITPIASFRPDEGGWINGTEMALQIAVG
jgi:hypothetical protein